MRLDAHAVVAADPPPAGPASFAHPALIAVMASLGLLLSGAVALRATVPARELKLTLWFNDAPDWVATLLYPIMQLGTVWVPLVAGLVLMIGRRDVVVGQATMVAGLAAWLVAKLVKQLVQRGRPRQYLPDINVREAASAGFGYPSGHSAVAAATAVMIMVALPRRWRPLAVVIALLVGVARIVHGVHLPADVVGGWALGTLVALSVVQVLDHIRAPRRQEIARVRGAN